MTTPFEAVATSITQDLSSIAPPIAEDPDELCDEDSRFYCALCDAGAPDRSSLESAYGHHGSCPWARAVTLWGRE